MNTLLLEQLKQLEADLAPLTHNPAILERVRAFTNELGSKTGQRQAVLNLHGVLQTALENGYPANADIFSVLQGDIISTQSAYFMGERLTGERRFMVLTPTCDLVFERRQYASLLEVKAIRADTPNAGVLLSSLTAFKRSDAMYLPALQADLERGILGFAVSFDGICSIGNTEIQTATRVASASLVGWRVFCAMLQSVLTRASEDEVILRKNFFVG